MRASYKRAIEWIAANDDTEFLADEPSYLSVTGCLVADLFGKSNEQVIKDLRREIARAGKETP